MNYPRGTISESETIHPVVYRSRWPGLMSWQAYRVVRFRRLRRELYPVVHVNQHDSLSSLLLPCKTTLENTDGEVRQTPSTMLGPPEQVSASRLGFERLGKGLEQHPDWDMAYLPSDPEVPVGAPFLARPKVAWALGMAPQSDLSVSSYWLQVGLLFNCHGLWKSSISRSSEFNSGTHLFTSLENLANPMLRIQADFIRDFYLSPWICCLHYSEDLASDHIGDVQKIDFITRLKSAITQAGNILLDFDGATNWCNYSRLWAPSVYLHICGNAQDVKPPQGLPPDTLKVLYVPTNQKSLPTLVDPAWDLCLAYGDAECRASEVPLLSRPWQGWVVSSDLSSLLNLLDIRVHAEHLRAIESFQAKPSPPERKISVVICSYHRPEALRQALQSIANQTLSPEDYEVVIVNNDPTDKATRQVVELSKADDFPGSTDTETVKNTVRLVESPLPGLSYARNAALSAVRGEIVCFLDDDALARPTWLEQISLAFDEHPEAGVVGGHIYLKTPQPRPDILRDGLERFWTQFVTPYQNYTVVHNWMDFPWGANWCIRRDVLSLMGGFRCQYGRRQRDYSGGEELIAASLAHLLDYTVAVQPSAVVDHQPEASRYTKAYLRKTIISQIIVNYRMRRDFYLPDSVTVMGNLRGTGRFARNLFKMMHLPPNERKSLAVEYFYLVQAWLHLFIEQMRDMWARFWYWE